MAELFHTLFPFIKAYQKGGSEYFFPAVWIVIILLFTIIYGIRFLLKYRSCKNSLLDTISSLQRCNSEITIEDFEELNQNLSDKEIISHLWSEFNETLVKIKDKDGQEKIFNTIDAHHFFNDSTLINPRINIRSFNAVPGYLTGLGILGTFIGLTFGLASIDIKNPAKLQKGIEGLLSGAKVAFSTSVWGIFCSILFSLFEKHNLNKLRNYVCKLQENIDKLFIRKTPESWLSDLLWESQQQSLELKRFNSDLAINIASALDEKLAASLTPALEKLLYSIEELTRSGTSKIAETITKGAGDEIARLTDTMGHVDRLLRDTIEHSQKLQNKMEETMQNQLGAFTENISGIVANLGEQTTSISNTMHSQVSGLSELINRLLRDTVEHSQKLQNKMEETMQNQLGTFTENISGIVTNLGEQTASISNTMHGQVNGLSELIKEQIGGVSSRYNDERSQLNNLLEKMDVTLKNVENILEGAGLAAEAFKESALPVKRVSSELLSIVEEIKTYQKTFSETVVNSQNHSDKMAKTVEETLSQMRNILETTEKNWQAYEEKFGEIREGLGDVFNELNKGLREYKEVTGQGIIEYLNKMDNSLKDAVGTLSGAIEQLSEVAEEFNEIKK